MIEDQNFLNNLPLNSVTLTSEDSQILLEIIKAKNFDSKPSQIGFMHELVVLKHKNPDTYKDIWATKKIIRYDQNDTVDGISIKTSAGSKVLESKIHDRHVLGRIACNYNDVHFNSNANLRMILVNELKDHLLKAYKFATHAEFHTVSQRSLENYHLILRGVINEYKIDFKYLSIPSQLLKNYINSVVIDQSIEFTKDGKWLLAFISYEWCLAQLAKIPASKTIEPEIKTEIKTEIKIESKADKAKSSYTKEYPTDNYKWSIIFDKSKKKHILHLNLTKEQAQKLNRKAKLDGKYSAIRIALSGASLNLFDSNEGKEVICKLYSSPNSIKDKSEFLTMDFNKLDEISFKNNEVIKAKNETISEISKPLVSNNLKELLEAKLKAVRTEQEIINQLLNIK